MMQFECVDLAAVREQQWHTDGPLMVMPFIDEAVAVRAGEHACQRAGAGGLLLAVHDAQRQGFIKTVNEVFARSQSRWFGYMAQDAFAGRDWMALALRALEHKGGAFLGFNDGKWRGLLASFGLAQREWAQGNYAGREFFYPGYTRHYADTELTLLAMQAKGYVYEPNSVLVEVDWAKEAQAVHAADRALYRQRAAQGFEGRVADKALQGLFA
jgi:hypothetical protein